LADPPSVEEIVAVMRSAGDGPYGRRLRGLIVVLWRAGLRINEALALSESDLDRRLGALLARRGKGGRRREVGMDEWGWEHLQPWLTCASSSRSARCSASSTAPPAAGRGRLRRCARICAERRGCRRAATLRATPAAPRPRGRDGPRGPAADRHPAPAGPHQPGHHLDLLQGIDNAETSTPSMPAAPR
jgi:integrase